MAALCPSVLRLSLRRYQSPKHVFISFLKMTRTDPTCTNLTKASSFSTSIRLHQSSYGQSGSASTQDYPADFEVSYEDFKFVEPLLPAEIVPEIPHYESYPTPSGWFPPNDDLRSQQKYSVCRTRNGYLPVYGKTERVYKNAYHEVVIENIEGDIWALEADLKAHLSEKVGGKIITHVHEVQQLIRVRGLHADSIAEFLFERGM